MYGIEQVTLSTRCLSVSAERRKEFQIGKLDML